jgi:hypothetical protein
MHLPRPSMPERYTNNLVVFVLSGAIHLAGDYKAGVSLAESRAMVFFPSFVPLFMIEDGVQHLWRRVRGPATRTDSSSCRIPLWQRTLGFLWVITCLSVMSPELLVVQLRGFLELSEATGLFDATRWVGAHILVGATILGGLFLHLLLDSEI